MIHIQIININGLSYTKNLIDDLMKQTHPFQLTIIDQGSTEKGTKEYLTTVSYEVIYNLCNISLSRLWNRLYEHSDSSLLCFLNNDLRIPSNFVEDTVNIFKREPEVGVVIHSTNHPNYQTTSELEYVTGEIIVQGWDFTMRKEVYTPIPDNFGTFGGDDWLFVQMFKRGWKLAICLSSPIIHYKAKSHRYYQGDRIKEEEIVRGYGIERLSYRSRYCQRFPTFEEIKETTGREKKGEKL